MYFCPVKLLHQRPKTQKLLPSTALNTNVLPKAHMAMSKRAGVLVLKLDAAGLACKGDCLLIDSIRRSVSAILSEFFHRFC